MSIENKYQIFSDFYANTDGHGYFYLQISGDKRWDCIRTEWHDSQEEAFEEFKAKLLILRDEIDKIVGSR